MLALAKEKMFWNPSRRRYVSKALSNVALMFVGALGTSEFLKASFVIKLGLATVALFFMVAGTIIEPFIKEGA